MAAVVEEKLAPVDARFINRTVVGTTTANIVKAAVWGNAFALSQAFGWAFYELRATAKASGKAISIQEFTKLGGSKLRVFWPSIVAHTAFFAAYRGNSADTIGIGGLIKPLLVTSLPTLGYAAYTRAMPPQFLTFSIASCVGLHIYDRHMNAKGLHTEHMPIGHMNRRVF